MREKVGVRGCYCFVEVDFGLGAGLYYYGAGLVAENAIAGKLISLDKADELGVLTGRQLRCQRPVAWRSRKACWPCLCAGCCVMVGYGCVVLQYTVAGVDVGERDVNRLRTPRCNGQGLRLRVRPP